MENIFKNLGYTVSKNRTSTNDKLVIINVIKNTDGTPRWVWNSNCEEPTFLKFYNVGSYKAKIYAFIIQLIFKLKLQKISFKKQQLFFAKEEDTFFDCEDAWSIFTGTIGPNNKAILYVNETFYKIATTTTAKAIIQNEHQTVQKLAAYSISFSIPASKAINPNIIQLSDVSQNGIRANEISEKHFAALNAFHQIENRTLKFKNWSSFQELKNQFDAISDSRIPSNLIRKINTLISKIQEKETIELSFSHGDFTQWNMFLNQETLSIYDWELASNDKPKGFDFFHYIIQKGILVDKKNWKTIYTSLKEALYHPANHLFDKQSEEEFNRYLKWYLLVCTMQYVIVYANQPKWHMQIEWLLQTWNEGLNTFLAEENTSKELIIMDVFDCLHNDAYAALKFTNGLPEKLSEWSDIDIVVDQTMNKKLTALLKNHSLVAQVSLAPKSFMNTLQIMTNQGDFLSIDLIWQLKIKNLTFFDAQKIIKNAFRNSYGVKLASVIDTTRYIVMFYILNGAKIPKKYLVYEEAFANSKSKLDGILKDYFEDESKSKKSILKYVHAKKENKRVQFFKNTCLYVMDTIRSFFQTKGFIITFSGVDGAGKSTVIEKLKFQLEKQFRKPVVVLRHRPSVLPILSVWIKGKEKAQQEVLASLPRQGKNASVVSSLIRFAYYYADYLIGQFVIYGKYISRGYVVVYDRYYFDFINDSKRSNIVLPQWISKFGYYFLLKPRFNFFLFADAETILSRKRELNKATIEKLNTDYQSLFKNLQSKSNYATYKAVKSETIEATLQNILFTIKS